MITAIIVFLCVVCFCANFCVQGQQINAVRASYDDEEERGAYVPDDGLALDAITSEIYGTLEATVPGMSDAMKRRLAKIIKERAHAQS